MEFLSPVLTPLDLLVLEVHFYEPSQFPPEKQCFVRAAIDPLTAKTHLMSRVLACKLMASVGIDAPRSIVGQIAHFDPLKNPIGVLEAYG